MKSGVRPSWVRGITPNFRGGTLTRLSSEREAQMGYQASFRPRRKDHRQVSGDVHEPGFRSQNPSPYKKTPLRTGRNGVLNIWERDSGRKPIPRKETTLLLRLSGAWFRARLHRESRGCCRGVWRARFSCFQAAAAQRRRAEVAADR